MEKNDFRILVADDDEIARDVVTALLSREGYPVVSAKTGDDALEVLRTDEISLVITDLRMPGADGIAVLKFAVRKNRNIAVVILTAYGTLDTALEAMREGAYDYLTKPFKGQEILILAEQAFKRALLVHEVKELRTELRDTYGDPGFITFLSEGAGPGARTGWIRRIERLGELDVLTPREVERLRERLVRGDGKGNDSHRG